MYNINLKKSKIQNLGINEIMQFGSFSSFSKRRSVAERFAGDDGIIIQLDTSNIEEVVQKVGLHSVYVAEISSISYFRSEEEVLITPFYAQVIEVPKENNTLTIKITDDRNVGAYFNHRIYVDNNL